MRSFARAMFSFLVLRFFARCGRAFNSLPPRFAPQSRCVQEKPLRPGLALRGSQKGLEVCGVSQALLLQFHGTSRKLVRPRLRGVGGSYSLLVLVLDSFPLGYALGYF